MNRRKQKQEIDKIIVATTGLLLLIGTVMVYSASAMLAESNFSGSAFFFKRQLIWLAASAAIITILAKIDYHIYKKLTWPLLLLALALLVGVLFATPLNGARRWFDLGYIKFQPTELFKYVLIIFAAVMLSIKRERIAIFRSLLFPALPVIGIAFALILFEPNLGAVLVLSTVVLVMFFAAGVKKRLLLLLFSIATLTVYLMVFVGGYKRTRIESYFDSISDPLRAGYQVKQSVIAIGSGGLIGKGLGRGFAKLFYLPAPHTDFVFATVAEEGGFLLALLVLTLFGILIWRGFRAAIYSTDLLGFYLALGISTLLFTQVAINLMVTTALIPATGLPLPLISYGGSSLLLTAAAIGILLNISRQQAPIPQLFGRENCR